MSCLLSGMTCQRDLHECWASVKRFRFKILQILLFCALLSNALFVFAAPIDELKAAYLLNFAKFTTWPADQFRNSNEPLIFCGFSNDPVMDAMLALGERRVDNRLVRIRAIKEVKDETGCHVLYAGRQASWPTGNGAIERRRGLLLVGDSERLLAQGGIILYFIQSGKLRFEINAENARAADLVLSARLLSLAKKREGGP